MPVEERTSRAERCSQHPASTSVARCDGCGRALCLTCAIPVRGLVLGSECLSQVLGEDAPEEPPQAPRASTVVVVAAAAFAVASLATIAPWTSLGEGSAVLGAWSGTPRWSSLAGLAAVVGLGIAVAGWRIPVPPRWWMAAVGALGAVVCATSLLAWFHPPFPADATPVPLIAAGAGLVASIATFARARPAVRRS